MSTDYIDELAAYADTNITAEEWRQTPEICRNLPEKPASLDALKEALETRPALQAQLAWRTGYTPSKWLLENELEQVNIRRKQHGIEPVDSNGDAYTRAANSGLLGVCFSGGGIRSATFNLGILQGLADLKLLHCIDYLSSVSGGGYIHQWLAAWSKRAGFNNVARELIPLPEEDSPRSHPEPIRWLRRYSNYLTPQRGFFTADTWVVFATWLRNTILNQIILISGLLFLMLLPHILTFDSLAPQHGPGGAIVIGAISYLFLMATFFLGKNLYSLFGGHPVAQLGLFGQRGVQLGIVTPLVTSSLLFILLFPLVSAALFGLHLFLCFIASMLLLFALALAIIFWGDVPYCYLRNHHRTSDYKSFSQFWHQKPKCWAHLKMVFVILGLVLVALLVSLCGAGWIILTCWWIAKLWSPFGHYWWRLVLVIGPPLVLAGILLTLILLLGLLGRTYDDARREWLARLGAWIGLYALAWIFFVGCALFGCTIIMWLRIKIAAGIPILIAWIGTSGLSVFAAKSPNTAGAEDNKASFKFKPLEILAIVGPYIFATGLLLLLSALAEVLLNTVCGRHWLVIVLTYAAPLITCLLFAWRVDINEFSMHAFYRNRIARCYLGASTIARDPNPFSGFDERDAQIALSALGPQYGYYGPFPIFCATLNLTFGEDLAWQERKAASFAFTPLYSGYDIGWTAAKSDTTDLRFNGFARTETYAYPQPGIHISTAAAISGAALSPNWGFHTNPATAFLLTAFNVRLGWWLRNPRAVDEYGRRLNVGQGGIVPEHSFRGLYPSPSPRSSLAYLINELLGRTNDTRKFVQLTDGGHFDNMGLYELVRRRCRYIVICDATSDGQLHFEDVGMAIRKCRIDFGAEVALDLRPLQYANDTEYSSAHCVVGRITYPEDMPKGHPQYRPGVVVYIKSSLTGDEPGDILNYKKEHSAFPHDTTANQWFTESQFESYRRLGQHVAYSIFEPARPETNDCAGLRQREAYFLTLRGTWFARTPEMEKHSAEHSKRYEALLRRIREDRSLPGFYEMLFTPGAGQWETNRTATEVAHARATSSDLIEFIFLVYLELNLVLPEKRTHPFSEGWYEVFRNWCKIDAVRHGWKTYRHGYSKSFGLFAERELNLKELS